MIITSLHSFIVYIGSCLPLTIHIDFTARFEIKVIFKG